MQQGGFRPRGRFSDDFHGRRSRGIRSGIRRVVPVLFPRHLGPDVLERLRQHRRLRFRLFQSLEGPRHLHAPVRRRIGPRRLPPQEHPLFRELERFGRLHVLRLLSRLDRRCRHLQRRGRVVEHPFGSERRVRTLSGLLLAGRHRKFRADRVEQVRPLRLQACFVVDAGAVVP